VNAEVVIYLTIQPKIFAGEFIFYSPAPNRRNVGASATMPAE
jgi:hypothetical protein